MAVVICCAKVGTYSAGKRRSLGRYNSLAHYSPRSLLFLFESKYYCCEIQSSETRLVQLKTTLAEFSKEDCYLMTCFSSDDDDDDDDDDVDVEYKLFFENTCTQTLFKVLVR
jgi:hypothetical protein